MSQSEWDNAPFNEADKKPEKVSVCASFSMSRPYDIEVTDYKQTEDYNDDCNRKVIVPDFSNSNLEEQFKKDENVIGLPDLLYYLKIFTKEKIERVSNYPLITASERKSRKELLKKLRLILDTCNKWVVDDFSVALD